MTPDFVKEVETALQDWLDKEPMDLVELVPNWPPLLARMSAIADRAYRAGLERGAEIVLSELSPHSSIATTLVDAIRAEAGEEKS